ncbi:acyl-CoA dehydrogenase [Paenibacillus sp. P46E]|nr:acyl-CoA dehydrogenase [Paenibacillus sp. P46E]
MAVDFSTVQKERQAEFRAFVDQDIMPYAAQIDQEECIPKAIIEKMVAKGYWGADLPREFGGSDMDLITAGLLHQEIGRGCSNVRNLIGVQGMVSSAILKWGTETQKRHWLPKMASGEVTTAFALTEPDVGSDIRNLQTEAVLEGSDYILNGAKKWITFGGSADLYIVFAKCQGRIGAFLVERNTPGFITTPIKGLLGFRGSMLAELTFEDCRIPAENVLSRIGFGLSHVANYGLSHGRYSTAWGCVGLAQACLESSVHYAAERQQGEKLLKDHQLIQEMIADMETNITCARLLCLHASYLRENNDERFVMETAKAKYFASRTAFNAANAAVQIHGANGCGSEYPVQRYLRDAKIMEIVEGSSQVQQIIIAAHAFRKKY